jgi:hypothetical protein
MDQQDPPEELRPQTPNYAGWASFEARVRGRRFSRVVELARTAIDQGRIDDASAALEEARSLAADAPEIAELEERLATRPVWNGELLLRSEIPEVDVESDPGWLRLIAGMAVVALLLFSVGFGLVQVMRTSTARELLTVRTSTATTDVMQTDTPAKAAPNPINAIQKIEKSAEPAAEIISTEPQAQPEPPAPSPPPPVVSRPTQTTRSVETAARGPASMTRPLDSGRSATPPPAPTMGMRLRPPSTGTATASPAEPPAIERVESDPVPAPSPVTPAVQSVQSPIADTVAHTASNASLSPVPSLDVPVRASHQTGDLVAREEESTRIRALLSRYETAYNRLDAKAASSVWPGVNQAALGRAFDGLLSQRVSLGLCDITVIGDIAGASCAGKARWEPKIGGGLQTADRHWKFNLRKTDDGWKIQQILVR